MTSLRLKNSPSAGRLRAPVKALAPHYSALLALALFLIAGLAVIDDYGVPVDEPLQRRIVDANLDYLANGGALDVSRGLRTDSDKFYGIAFEAPLALAARAFDPQDERSVYLSRHLLTHLFFLAGGLFAYLLARRLFRNPAVAIIAMTIFLLHPRLYAHSFFNSKDIAFLAMFIIALFLARGAFRRDTLWAFVLLGAAVGVLVNLRIMGAVLLAAIPALRALDLAFAQGGAERKRILLATGAFALTAALTTYVLLPYLWADPLGRAVEWWTTLSDHPVTPDALFRGTLYRSDEFSPDYLPVWFSISSPPFALLLGVIGAAAVLLVAARAPQVAIRSGNSRFGLLLVGCIAAPVAAVILLDANIYTGWRHMYFLWAPFALLAALGLQTLLSALRRTRLRAATYAAAGVGVATTLLSMTFIHPNEQVYFNALVDRVTPERLRSQYVIDYWRHPMRQALEWLADNPHALPNNLVATSQFNHEMTLENLDILPDAARARVTEGLSVASIVPTQAGRRAWPLSNLALGRARVYDNTLYVIEPKADLQAVYEATQGRKPDIDAAFDVHRLDDSLAFVMEPCAPSFIERTSVGLRTTPVDPNDLPPWRRDKGFEAQQWPLSTYGAAFDGKCVASLPLQNYPVAELQVTWDTDLVGETEAKETMRRAQEEGRLLARAAQDVYLSGNDIVYIQESCDPAETERVFYADIAPERVADLPEDWRRRGYERFRFDFYPRGAFVGEACVTTFALPDYPVSAVRTGQSTPEGGDAWRAEFSLNAEPHRSAYLPAARTQPLVRRVFDVYLIDGALVYAKESCDWSDTEARFFLHLEPERVEDLPEGRRAHGFDNLDFTFFGSGGYFDGKCAARVPLPEYSIASVRTGQFGSAGEIWRAEFAVEGGRFPLSRE